MLRLVVGDDSELSRTVYTHTRRVIFPLPLLFYNRQQLESAVGRRLAKHCASRLLSFFSGSLLLKNPKNSSCLPANSPILDSLLEILSFPRKIGRKSWITMKVQVTKVTCRRVRYRVWIQVIPTRKEDLNSMGRVMTTDHRFFHDERQGCTTVQYFLLFVKHAATVNYPEGGWARQQITPLNR